MDWEKVRIFHAVAEAGSLSLAGKHLNLTQSTVSRHILSLEESLDTALFHRHSRGLSLTEQGDYLFKTTADVFLKLKTAQNHLTDLKHETEGPLVITSTRFFGATWLTQAVSDFAKDYPDIQLNLKLSSQELDLGMREADIAIRMKPPKHQDLIQRHFVKFSFHLYASKKYIIKNGDIETMNDLHNHHLICYPKDTNGPFHDDNWILKLTGIDVATHTRLTVTSSLYSIYQLTKNDVGISCLPDYVAQKDNDLVQILPHIERPAVDSYFCFPEELRSSARIQSFRNYIIKRAADFFK